MSNEVRKKVIFRKRRTKDGDILALFPEIPPYNSGDFPFDDGVDSCKIFSTGHWAYVFSDYKSIIRQTIPANPIEYGKIKEPLEKFLNCKLEVFEKITPEMIKVRRLNAAELKDKYFYEINNIEFKYVIHSILIAIIAILICVSGFIYGNMAIAIFALIICLLLTIWSVLILEKDASLIKLFDSRNIGELTWFVFIAALFFGPLVTVFVLIVGIKELIVKSKKYLRKY